MRVESDLVTCKRADRLFGNADEDSVPQPVRFKKAFRAAPTVVVGIAGLVFGNGGVRKRVTVQAENIEPGGFMLVTEWNQHVQEVTAFWLAINPE